MKNKKAQAVLIGVIIISTIILTIGISMTMLNLSMLKISKNNTNAASIYINTDGCAEESLIRQSRNNGYLGETLIVDATTCIITVTGTDNARTININASIQNYTRQLQIDVILDHSFFSMNKF